MERIRRDLSDFGVEEERTLSDDMIEESGFYGGCCIRGVDALWGFVELP